MEAFVEETNCKGPIPWSVVNLHNAHRIEMRGESMQKKRNPRQDDKKE